VLNLTRVYIARHQELVVPLVQKYAEEWRVTGHPVYRPMWWLSPDDPATFTIDDQFLIGDEVTSVMEISVGAQLNIICSHLRQTVFTSQHVHN